ncbi:MAG: DUF3501 family protein, partial [Limnobacter sp.]|nr:DUF3501 family protein [Limnobacter sp.]
LVIRIRHRDTVTMHSFTSLLQQLHDTEHYNLNRETIRPQMLGYKANRAVQLGPFMRIQFEDSLTLAYQVQEILRLEKLQSPENFTDEWLAYKALHSEPGLYTATLMMELQSPALLKTHLWQLNRAAENLYLEAGFHQCHAAVNTDLIEPDGILRGVHFLAFRPSLAFLAELQTGVPLRLRCDDASFNFRVALNDTVRKAFCGCNVSRLTRALKRFP